MPKLAATAEIPASKAIDGAALAKRLVQARADANEFIDAEAAKLKKEFPLLPIQTLRQQITNKSPNCACRAALINLGADK